MNSKYDLLLLDMDGVCCDFVSEACRVCGHPGHHVTGWNFYEDFGMTLEDFWHKIHMAGTSFWRNLPEYEDFWNLYRACRLAADDVVFCTTPSRSPDSYMGKVQWLQDRLGEDFHDIIMMEKKERLARPGVCLVDDSASSWEKFQKAGGHSIIVPRPWNEKVVHYGNAIAYSLLLSLANEPIEA